MDRRSFLALLASAPIAALLPLPKALPTPRAPLPHDAFFVPAVRSLSEEEILEQYIRPAGRKLAADYRAYMDRAYRDYELQAR